MSEPAIEVVCRCFVPMEGSKYGFAGYCMLCAQPLRDRGDVDLAAYVEKFRQFAANWNVPPSRASLKMFLACALDSEMIQAGVTAIGDELWERYYQQVLNAWTGEALL